MANELTFKIIDMRRLIQQHMEGHISEEELIEFCSALLHGVDKVPARDNKPTSVFGRNGGSTGDVIE